MSYNTKIATIQLICCLILSAVPAYAEPSTWKEFFDAGEKYKREGNAEKAEQMYSLALTKAKISGATDAQLAHIQVFLAGTYRHEGKYRQAEDAYKRAIPLYEKSAPHSQHYADCLASLADIYGHQKRYADAEPLLDKSTPIYERTLGPNSTHFAAHLMELGVAQSEIGNYQDAEQSFQRAVAIYEKKPLSKTGDGLAVTLHRMANMYTAASRYELAEPLYKRALYIAEAMGYPRDSDVLDTMSDYIKSLERAGRTDDATHMEWRMNQIYQSAETVPSGVDPEGVDVSKYYRPGMDNRGVPLNLAPQEWPTRNIGGRYKPPRTHSQ